MNQINLSDIEKKENLEIFDYDEKLGFPKVIKNKSNSLTLKNWLKENQSFYDEVLRNKGAILCRGFEIDSVEKFQVVSKIFSNELLEYKLRSSPRYEITDNVYVSTTYPKEQSINMHSENSYSPQSPSRITFCCVEPADEMGETPISDNRIVLRNIAPEILKKFREYGVLYKRNLTGLLGMSWEEVFQTNKKDEAEQICRDNSMNFTWKGENHLELSWVKNAIWNHPITGEEVWFNHAMFFNKHLFNKDLLDFINSDDELPNNTYFGNGDSINKEEIENIREAYDKAKVEFPWQKGDVLFLDNYLISHGRNPYEGNRKIIVSMS